MTEIDLVCALSDILRYGDEDHDACCGCAVCTRIATVDGRGLLLVQANKLAYLLIGLGMDPLKICADGRQVFATFSDVLGCCDEIVGITYAFDGHGEHLTRDQVVAAVLHEWKALGTRDDPSVEALIRIIRQMKYEAVDVNWTFAKSEQTSRILGLYAEAEEIQKQAEATQETAG